MKLTMRFMRLLFIALSIEARFIRNDGEMVGEKKT